MLWGQLYPSLLPDWLRGLLQIEVSVGSGCSILAADLQAAKRPEGAVG
jgi:hypothetical protein